jgi:hypothetical protein
MDYISLLAMVAKYAVEIPPGRQCGSLPFAAEAAVRITSTAADQVGRTPHVDPTRPLAARRRDRSIWGCRDAARQPRYAFLSYSSPRRSLGTMRL